MFLIFISVSIVITLNKWLRNETKTAEKSECSISSITSSDIFELSKASEGKFTRKNAKYFYCKWGTTRRIKSTDLITAKYFSENNLVIAITVGCIIDSRYLFRLVTTTQ